MRGADKLLQEIDGAPLLRRQAEAAARTGARVLVALRPADADRLAALDGLAVEIVEVTDAASGMGHSIAAGARAALGADGLMILNADMPGIATDEMAAVLAAFRAVPERIWRGMTPDGRAGHPVLFPGALIPDLERLSGDTGARALIAREGAVMVPLPDDAAILDLDTPEAWADWRARR